MIEPRTSSKLNMLWQYPIIIYHNVNKEVYIPCAPQATTQTEIQGLCRRLEECLFVWLMAPLETASSELLMHGYPWLSGTCHVKRRTLTFDSVYQTDKMVDWMEVSLYSYCH